MGIALRLSPFMRALGLLALCVTLAVAVGCSGKKAAKSGTGKKRIILLNNTADPYWDAAAAGLKKASEDFKLDVQGYEASMDTNSGGDEGQVQKLQEYAQQDDIAAIIISPTSGKNRAIAEELRKLQDTGVIIGCIDSDLDEKYKRARGFYIGTDNLMAGKVLGSAAAAIKTDGGQYVQFVGSDSQQNAIERMNGFSGAVGPKYKELDRKIDDKDKKRAQDNVHDVLDKYPDLNILVGIWAYNAPAIVEVVKDKKVRDKTTIVTFDADPAAIRAMGEGQIDAMVVQDPFGMGYESVRYIMAKLTKDQATIKAMFPNMGKPNGDIMDTGVKLVVPAESPILKSADIAAFGKNVKVMPLPEFQDWLKKYGLNGT
ncbi:MAG: substrate-binding domain-containing protein [Pirellulales bacterium]